MGVVAATPFCCVASEDSDAHPQRTKPGYEIIPVGGGVKHVCRRGSEDDVDIVGIPALPEAPSDAAGGGGSGCRLPVGGEIKLLAEHPHDSALEPDSPSSALVGFAEAVDRDSFGDPKPLPEHPHDSAHGSDASAARRPSQVFSATFDRTVVAKDLGLDFAVGLHGRALVVKRLMPGLAKDYNRVCTKGAAIKVGDYVYSINGAKDNAMAMLDQYHTSPKLEISYGRPIA